jgi:molybdopterin-containing oxidoreductase family membrane subunit
VADGQQIITPGYTYGSVTQKISSIVLAQRTPWGWLIGFGISFALLTVLMIAVTYLLVVGVGIWGINIPVGWGFAIVNFVWWVGIGHAGTLISAILLLFRQRWRTSINRFAEAMTLFAVACAGMFPILHLGRPDLFYWLIPYPNTMALWPQFRSPLVWDVFAVGTYMTCRSSSGMSDSFRISARSVTDRRAVLVRSSMVFLPWGGEDRQSTWHHHEVAYLLLAGLATALVISVHTVVSFDFAVGIVPGWHSTIFPPYFVAGAIYSGFAMVMTLAIPLRAAYGLQDFITMKHLSNMAKVMLATGSIVAYGYFTEAFMAWYSGSGVELYMVVNRLRGPYAPLYWALLATNVLLPQALWFRRVRSSVLLLFLVAMSVNVGMWLERFVIVVTSLHRDFLPSSWGMYYPTIWDWATFIGSIGLFLTLLFLFIRFLPVISIFEMRQILPEPQRRMRHETSAAVWTHGGV